MNAIIVPAMSTLQFRHGSGRAAPIALALGFALALVAPVLLPPISARAAGEGALVAVGIPSPRVFPAGGTTTLEYSLATPAHVTASVVDYAGRLVRRLATDLALPAGTHALTWDGRTDASTGAAYAGYRIVVRAVRPDGTSAASVAAVTKHPLAVYPVAPSTIVVALDPGHGGYDPGAIGSGLYEKTANLDIGRRLAAMLTGAGITVVMTRTTDTHVNRTRTDWNADGRLDKADELAARIEVANGAAADVFVVLHNNAADSSLLNGTEDWYSAERPWAGANATLARELLAPVVPSLRGLSISGFTPVSRGSKRGRFYVSAPYDGLRRPRPSLMPSVLTEGLFLSNSGDLRALKSPTVRQRIAAAYYQGLARYFAARSVAARYRLLEAPAASATEGSGAELVVRVTNTASIVLPAATSVGVGAVGAVPYYDGSSQAGLPLGAAPLGVDLAPGESAAVRVPFSAPAYESLVSTGGRALLKIDLVGTDGFRFALRGVVPLQLPFTVTPAPTDPTPSPTPTPTPTPTPVP